MITSHGLLHTTTWNNRIPTYTLSHGLPLISCFRKIIQFHYCEQDSMKRVLNMKKSDVVTTRRCHNVKTAIFHFIPHFSLDWNVYFFTLSFDFLKHIANSFQFNTTIFSHIFCVINSTFFYKIFYFILIEFPWTFCHV